MHYQKDFGIQVRIARFHNVYGPNGTWKGGREKAPAAFSRKAIVSEKDFEMWGDGKQTRSFCYIDDAVEGIMKLFLSAYDHPLNIGSDEMISMNDMAKLAMSFVDKDLPIRHIPGPEGVRGRNRYCLTMCCNNDNNANTTIMTIIIIIIIIIRIIIIIIRIIIIIIRRIIIITINTNIT